MLPQVAEHVRVVPVVSADTVYASHPLVLSGSGSIVQLTVTLLVYQPLEPSVPRIDGVTDAPLAPAADGMTKLSPSSARTASRDRPGELPRRPVRRSNCRVGTAPTMLPPTAVA